MMRIEEYHNEGFDLWQTGKWAGVFLLWIALFQISDHVATLPGAATVLLLSLATASLCRDLFSQERAGSWISQTHLHVYDGRHHASYPLKRIHAVRGLGLRLLPGCPLLVLRNGRTILLPRTALPQVRDMRRWMASHAIEVSATGLPVWAHSLRQLLHRIGVPV